MIYNNLSSDEVETIIAFFSYVDTNKDGFISKEEIENAMAVDFDNDSNITEVEKVKAGAQWISSNFPLQDLNVDNKLSLNELLQFNNDSA